MIPGDEIEIPFKVLPDQLRIASKALRDGRIQLQHFHVRAWFIRFCELLAQDVHIDSASEHLVDVGREAQRSVSTERDYALARCVSEATANMYR